MAIIISKRIQTKLWEKHNVTIKEVTECFFNQDRTALKDQREEHDTDPPTLWIITETNHCRALKLLFMVKDGDVILKSAFKPNQNEIDIYEKYSRCL